MTLKKFRKGLSTAKYLYTLLYLTLFSLFYNAYVHAYAYNSPPTQLLYQGTVLFGVVLLAVDFFSCAVFLRSKYSTVLCAFYLAVAVSVLANLSFDPVGNLKTVAWMLIQTFVFAALDPGESREHHIRWFCRVTESFSAVWFVGAVWSFFLFLAGYAGTLTSHEATTETLRVGFTEGRLFGVFCDPNYAALCILFSVLMILCKDVLKKEENPLLRLYHVLLLVFDLIYVLLSRSRMAEICLLAGIAVVAFFLCARHFALKKGFAPVKRWGAALLAAVLLAGLSYGAVTVANKGLDLLYLSVAGHGGSETSTEDLEDALENLKRPDVDENNPASSASRSKIWSDYFKVFLKKPVFGTGPRNGLSYCKEWFPDSFVAQRGYSVHNGYLGLLVGAGTVGALVMVFFLILVVKDVLSYLIRRADKADDPIYLPTVLLTALLCIGAMAALPLSALFFTNSACDAIFWFALGFVLNLIRLSGFDLKEKPSVLFRMTRFFRKEKE